MFTIFFLGMGLLDAVVIALLLGAGILALTLISRVAGKCVGSFRKGFREGNE